MTKVISLIVPVFNEEETINIFYRTVRKELILPDCVVEIVFINDGIICQNNFRHSFSLTWSGKTCDIRRSL